MTDLAAPDSALLLEAAAIDGDAKRSEQGPAAGAAAPSSSPATVDWPHEARDLVDFAAELLFPLYPRLAGVWDDDRRARLIARLAPVLQKYDLNLERILGRWGPEIMLAAVALPAVVPTYQAIRADLADLKAGKMPPLSAASSSSVSPPSSSSSSGPGEISPDAPPAAAGSTAPAPPDPVLLHKRA